MTISLWESKMVIYSLEKMFARAFCLAGGMIWKVVDPFGQGSSWKEQVQKDGIFRL